MNVSMKSLSTLAAAVVLATGFAVTASAQPPSVPGDSMAKSSDQPVTDTWITTKVKSELATTEGVKSTKISVKTVDGVVTLIGVLASDTAVEKATAAAKSVKGVKDVDASGLKVK